MSRIGVGMEGRPHISTKNVCLFWFRTPPSTPYSSGVQICTMNCIESFDKVNRKSGEKKTCRRRAWGGRKEILDKNPLNNNLKSIFNQSVPFLLSPCWETLMASLPSLQNLGNALLNVAFSTGKSNIYLSWKKSTSSNWLEMLNYVQFVAINL